MNPKNKPVPVDDSVEKTTPDDSHMRRPVRSFVLRGGRLTDAQKRALDELWPRYGLQIGDGPLDFSVLFGNAHPVILEIGFGNGDATWRMALANPDENYVGVEVHRPGVGHLLLQLEEHAIPNVRVACEDAVEFLDVCVRPASLDGVRLYFPDPWPKKRHHKRRIVQPGFISSLAQKIAPGGLLHMATDWAPYAVHMLNVMAASADFTNVADSGEYCPRPEWRPMTKYEKRGERLGHEVYDLLFLRNSKT